MPKYLYKVHYTPQGLAGIKTDGAASRIEAVSSMASSLGGHVEAFYFAFGDADAYVVADIPDDETAAAVSLAVANSGAATLSTVKLLTAAQVDAAIGTKVPYRPPGG